MLSSKVRYALKALLFLARQHDRGPVLISEIAHSERIPRKFLELILLDLKKHGLLQSKKGKGGGYFLRRNPSAVSVGDIVRALEGQIEPQPCTGGMEGAGCQECDNEEACGARMVMQEVNDATSKILDSTTVANLLDRIELVSASPQQSMYCI